MKTIIHAVHIHAPPATVYENLTTREGLAGWWTTQVAVEPREGGVVDFTFMDVFSPDMRQDELVPGKRVRWTCVGGHDNWQDNTFAFDLEEREGETHLMFRQEYAQELADEVYGTYNFNWGYYLGSLKQLCETGTGTPYDPET